MANRDQTGPEGRGPRTGRGAGSCPVTGVPDGGSNIPRAIPTGVGRGRGGVGRGLVRPAGRRSGR